MDTCTQTYPESEHSPNDSGHWSAWQDVYHKWCTLEMAHFSSDTEVGHFYLGVLLSLKYINKLY